VKNETTIPLRLVNHLYLALGMKAYVFTVLGLLKKDVNVSEAMTSAITPKHELAMGQKLRLE